MHHSFIKKLPIGLLIASCTLLASCTRNMSSDVYTTSSSSGKVIEGTIVSARSVTIKENDKLTKNSGGILGGGLAGGVAGSAIGNGSGNAIAVVGGALLGAAAGALAEDALGTSEGMEYVVNINEKHKSAAHNKRTATIGKSSVSNDINNSIDVSASTNLISVVQSKDVIFHKGQKVLVIYSNDRPRITSLN